MARPDNRELINRFYATLNARKFDNLSEIVDPDVVQEWPQSGERIRGLKNFRAVLENYPELPSVEPRRVAGAEDTWVLTPSWTALRITGSGDVYTVETRINYPSGEVWSGGVSVVEFRNGKASKLTEYFAAPFPAAEWRSPWVEQIESNT